jgi:hypothetical protein
MRTSSRSRSRLAALLAGVVGLLVAQVGLLATPAAALSTVGELRDAIDDANAANVDTVIELDAGSTFLVTGADCGVPGEDGNASGDFDITNTATTTFATVGTGAPALVEMDCPSERVFENTLHGTVVFDTVVITGGDLNPYIAMESPDPVYGLTTIRIAASPIASPLRAWCGVHRSSSGGPWAAAR